MFVDGYYVDNPAVAINVGHYLRKHGGRGTANANQTIKLIVTNTNEYWDSEFNIGQILHYFSTTFNQGVDPGGFLWGPGLQAPYRSPQIFENYLDQEGLNNTLVPIPNSNMTTATLHGNTVTSSNQHKHKHKPIALTTVDNPAFGVVAGQRVAILLLNLNANITTYVIGKTAVDEWTQPLADMTNHVAFNDDLLERVRTFVEYDYDEDEDY
mmetsp:Transcript_17738/g.37073  ORF Transcript_17738/g.37073 Transcript_17738/m.37073 type:complete len:211 (+) Transcript_17738:2519-3151(+)